MLNLIIRIARNLRHTQRTFKLLMAIILLFSILLGRVSSYVLGAVNPDNAIAEQILAQLNVWRIREGLSPVKPNATLRTMAIDQAIYLAGLKGLPGGEDGGDIHLDRSGQTPPQRAIKPPYNWPSYGRPDRTAIGEIAAVGTIDFALYFWSKSDIHRRTALSAAYREVGVAAVPYQSGYLFIVDYGARPDVLPAFISPHEHGIYLTNEQYRWKSGGDWIHSAKQIQFLADNGQPLHSEPELWQQKLVYDDNWGTSFKILYIDGDTKAVVPVDISADVVVLPDTLTVQVAETGTSPTMTPKPYLTTDAATTQPIESPSYTPTPTVVLTTTPLTPASLVIYYDSESLTLLNNTNG